MKKILILEDSPERHTAFRRKHPEGIIYETAAEMIAELDKGEDILYLFLDHDLGGLTNVDSSDENTGSEVVRHLLRNKNLINKIQAIIVHSMNGPEGDRMYLNLKEAGYYTQLIRFLTLEREYLYK